MIVTNTFPSAAAFNHGRIVELLLENGADPEAKDMLAMTPFLIAVILGASQSVQVLLDHGADITATDSSLNSCLHLAISYRRADMVKMLLERGKDKLLPLKDEHLSTVLHLAAGLEDSKVSFFPAFTLLWWLASISVIENMLILKSNNFFSVSDKIYSMQFPTK